MGSAQNVPTVFCNCDKCEIRKRLEYGISKFTAVVKYWERLSNEYCKHFFKPPLTVATEILDNLQTIVQELHRATEIRTPDFRHLVKLSHAVTKKQVQLYNEMGREADRLLDRFKGFRSDGLVRLFREWMKIQETGLDDNYVVPNYEYPRRNEAHDKFMEAFDVLIIHPLEELHMELNQPREQIVGLNPCFNMNFFNVYEREPSISSLVDSEDDPDDDPDDYSELSYLPPEEGEFEEFRYKWTALVMSRRAVFQETPLHTTEEEMNHSEMFRNWSLQADTTALEAAFQAYCYVENGPQRPRSGRIRRRARRIRGRVARLQTPPERQDVLPGNPEARFVRPDINPGDPRFHHERPEIQLEGPQGFHMGPQVLPEIPQALLDARTGTPQDSDNEPNPVLRPNRAPTSSSEDENDDAPKWEMRPLRRENEAENQEAINGVEIPIEPKDNNVEEPGNEGVEECNGVMEVVEVDAGYEGGEE